MKKNRVQALRDRSEQRAQLRARMQARAERMAEQTVEWIDLDEVISAVKRTNYSDLKAKVRNHILAKQREFKLRRLAQQIIEVLDGE